MSVSTVGVPQVFSASLTCLAGGYAPGTAYVPSTSGAFIPAPLANLNGTSRVRSIVRTALAGTAGTPSVQILAPSVAGVSGTPFSSQWRLGLISSNILDLSTYQVNWQNDYTPSPSFTQGSTLEPPVTVVPAALQQFAP